MKAVKRVRLKRNAIEETLKLGADPEWFSELREFTEIDFREFEEEYLIDSMKINLKLSKNNEFSCYNLERDEWEEANKQTLNPLNTTTNKDYLGKGLTVKQFYRNLIEVIDANIKYISKRDVMVYIWRYIEKEWKLEDEDKIAEQTLLIFNDIKRQRNLD